MCSILTKTRVIGKKNQSFFRFVSMPKKIRQKGRYNDCVGYWDMRKNKETKYFVINISALFFKYFLGGKPNKTMFTQLFHFFIHSKSLSSWFYFKEYQIYYLIENEVKKIYL